MRSVVVEAIHGQAIRVNDVGRHAGEDGVSLREKGVESAAEAIIVELVGGDAPEVLGAGFLGPLSDVNQRQRLRQSRSQEQTQYLAMREFELWIGRQMAIDDGRQLHLLQERRDDGQRSKIAASPRQRQI